MNINTKIALKIKFGRLIKEITGVFEIILNLNRFPMIRPIFK